ncbi:BrnA antitoxin family protein [Geomonas sp. Red32]|uniref:BrnA antitoxin family protein n=1 Tax=Geomonas sp. Red32 TaxID=2912856 RepID=UPI00202CC181|nr:BrnA antitoxin family protein [Geomonas sp. Red32]MCM0081554.1 BrnA antitoxin family protein [Geomonas sp. Red32]
MKKNYDFSDGVRGLVVPPDSTKTRITIRIDNDILDWFRAKVNEQGGGNYQTMINQALRSCIQEKPLKELIREAVREELSNLKPVV